MIVAQLVGFTLSQPVQAGIMAMKNPARIRSIGSPNRRGLARHGIDCAAEFGLGSIFEVHSACLWAVCHRDFVAHRSQMLWICSLLAPCRDGKPLQIQAKATLKTLPRPRSHGDACPIRGRCFPSYLPAAIPYWKSGQTHTIDI